MEKISNILFDGVKLNRPKFINSYGVSVRIEDYFDAMNESFLDEVAMNKIPATYELPLGCQLELTYRCNQKCIHCYNQSGGKNSSRESLSIDEWKDICHQLGNLGIFQCVISGGEPTLLGDHLFEIMDILHDYNIEFIFITNGMLLNEEKVNRLRKYKFSWVQVSIDGSRPDLHDYVRGVPSWKKAIKAATLVKQAGLPLVIAHAIVKKNVPFLEEMIDMAYLIGAQQITTGPFDLLGRAMKNVDEIALNQDDIEYVNSVLDKKIVEYRNKMDVIVSVEEPCSLRFRLIEPNSVMLIRPNGDVKIDCTAPFIIGNVKENNLKDIWDNMGKRVWEHPRVLEYVNSVKKSSDLLTASPRVNVDPDERLYPVK